MAERSLVVYLPPTTLDRNQVSDVIRIEYPQNVRVSIRARITLILPFPKWTVLVRKDSPVGKVVFQDGSNVWPRTPSRYDPSSLALQVERRYPITEPGTYFVEISATWGVELYVTVTYDVPSPVPQPGTQPGTGGGGPPPQGGTQPSGGGMQPGAGTGGGTQTGTAPGQQQQIITIPTVPSPERDRLVLIAGAALLLLGALGLVLATAGREE